MWFVWLNALHGLTLKDFGRSFVELLKPGRCSVFVVGATRVATSAWEGRFKAITRVLYFTILALLLIGHPKAYYCGINIMILNFRGFFLGKSWWMANVELNCHWSVTQTLEFYSKLESASQLRIQTGGDDFLLERLPGSSRSVSGAQ